MADRIHYDERQRTVWIDDAEPVVVRAKSFAVFMALVQAYPEPVSKEDLIEQVWDGAAVSDDSITQSIAALRRALGDKDHTVLQTNPGRGYRLMVPAGAAVAAAETAAPEPVPRAAPPSRNRLFLVAALVLVLLVGGGLALFLFVGQRAPQPPVVAQSDKPAVAVLEFDVLGGQDALGTFALGLQSDLIIALSELDTVRVLAPSVLAGDDAGETPLRAYVSHGARFVVGGTVQQRDAALRVSGHLIDTSTSQIVWVRAWEGDKGDIRGLQDRIVAALAGELANPWSGQITGVGSGLTGTDGETTDLRGHILMGAARLEEFHPLALKEAETHFRKALELDAHNAEAWAGLALAIGAMIPLADGDEAKSLRDARANAGRQSYHMGDGSGRSLVAGSWTAALRGNRREALRRLQEGADKLSSDADGLATASLQAALTTELYDEALAWGAQALALRDPAPGWYRLGPAYAHVFQGDYATAVKVLQSGPDGYAPAMALLAALEQAQGNTQNSIETAARLRMLHNDFSIESFLGAELFYPDVKRDTLRALFADTTMR